ncbi:MAG: helix-turn-helix domain-containing protein, partial [Spiribacter salinus]
MKHPGPVEKMQLLASAAGLPRLTRAELAVLIILADMSNAETGLAWPSFDTLAQRTGIGRRTVKRVVKRLNANRLVLIVEHGNRVRSNRYRINRELLQGGGGPQTTTPTTGVVVHRPLGWWSMDHQGGGPWVPDVVVHGPPESVHQSKMESEIDGGSQAEADATAYAAAPLRPRVQRGGDRFPEFWEAIGRRTTVKAAEDLLADALANGAEYQAVVDGAERYRAYCDRTGWRKAQSASAWIKSEGWRDDWTPPPKQAPKEKKANAKPAQDTGDARDTEDDEMARSEWIKRREENRRSLIAAAGYDPDEECYEMFKFKAKQDGANLAHVEIVAAHEEWLAANPDPD